MPKISPEQVQQIVSDYENNISVYDIAPKYGVEAATIYYYIRKSGCTHKIRPGLSEDEIEFLKTNYSTMSWRELTNTLNKSKGYIMQIAYSFGLKRDYFWTENEIEILKEFYFEKSREELSDLLGGKFSISDINSKANKIGLRTKEKWSEDEINTMKKYYEIYSLDEMQKLLPNRSRVMIISMATRLGLTSAFYYSNSEIEFIKENWEKMSDKEMALALKRPFRGIKAKRILLSLSREKEFTGLETLREYINPKNKEWKKKSLHACGYACYLTGKKGVEIHHLYSINLILKETLDILGLEAKNYIVEYSENELKSILDTFFNVQNKYPLGVCLTKKIHTCFHQTYGYGYNTPEQFFEFEDLYRNGIIKTA